MNLPNQSNTYSHLEKLVLQMEMCNDDGLKKKMEGLFAECAADMQSHSDKLLATLIIKALNKRICSEVIDENIYEKSYEIPQIQLFNLLIDKFPFVKFSQQLANNAIADLIRPEQVATLIDIGIGQGTQILHILELLKSTRTLKKLIIVGVEPFPKALSIARERILAFSNSLPFEVYFIAKEEYIEKMDFSTLVDLPGKIVVNASLALHHIQSAEQRLATLQRVKQLNPAAFMMIEPNVNHFESDLFERFKHCFKHFYSIFKVIDKLDIEETDKIALKIFFGREIEDILGKQEYDRFEKHEKATEWIGRLRKCEFRIVEDKLRLPLQSYFGVEMKYHKEGFFGFTFEDETVLAVIYAN